MRVVYVTPMDDPMYRRLFAFPRMVEDLLRAVAAGGWIDAVDFGTLRKLPADHVGNHGQQRRGDAVWRVGFQDRWLYLLILLEFQSSVDARMALRILEYTALLYRELDRQNELGAPRRWPAVLPTCCTTATRHGRRRWRCASRSGRCRRHWRRASRRSARCCLTSGAQRWTICHSAT